MVWDSACIGIVDNEALVLHVILSPPDAGTVTYFVPVVIINPLEPGYDQNEV